MFFRLISSFPVCDQSPAYMQVHIKTMLEVNSNGSLKCARHPLLKQQQQQKKKKKKKKKKRV